MKYLFTVIFSIFLMVYIPNFGLFTRIINKESETGGKLIWEMSEYQWKGFCANNITNWVTISLVGNSELYINSKKNLSQLYIHISKIILLQ